MVVLVEIATCRTGTCSALDEISSNVTGRVSAVQHRNAYAIKESSETLSTENKYVVVVVEISTCRTGTCSALDEISSNVTGRVSAVQHLNTYAITESSETLSTENKYVVVLVDIATCRTGTCSALDEISSNVTGRVSAVQHRNAYTITESSETLSTENKTSMW